MSDTTIVLDQHQKNELTQQLQDILDEAFEGLAFAVCREEILEVLEGLTAKVKEDTGHCTCGHVLSEEERQDLIVAKKS